MNRRQLLKGFAALAGAAVVGPALIALPSAEQARLVEMMKTGIIKDQTFVFEAGEKIPLVNDLVIHNCRFIWRGAPPKGALVDLTDRQNVTISYCSFTDLTNTATAVQLPAFDAA